MNLVLCSECARYDCHHLEEQAQLLQYVQKARLEWQMDHVRRYIDDMPAVESRFDITSGKAWAKL